MVTMLGWFKALAALAARAKRRLSSGGDVSSGDDFERDVASQGGIEGLVDSAHTAFAELENDFVLRDLLSGEESRAGWGGGKRGGYGQGGLVEESGSIGDGEQGFHFGAQIGVCTTGAIKICGTIGGREAEGLIQNLPNAHPMRAGGTAGNRALHDYGLERVPVSRTTLRQCPAAVPPSSRSGQARAVTQSRFAVAREMWAEHWKSSVAAIRIRSGILRDRASQDRN